MKYETTIHGSSDVGFTVEVVNTETGTTAAMNRSSGDMKIPDYQHPYLVQRLIRRDDALGIGVDRVFHPDYMGASEFEWGALPEALKTMRQNKAEYQILQVSDGAREAWAVAPLAYRDGICEFFGDQVNDFRKIRLKEWTAIAEQYAERDEDFAIHGWWAIPGERAFSSRTFLPWCLFVTEQHAKDWAAACWPEETT